MIDLEEQLTDHLRRRAAGVNPRHDLEAVERGIASVGLVHRDDRRTPRPRIGALVGAAAAAAFVGVAVVGTLTRDDRSTTLTQDERSTTVTELSIAPSPTATVVGGPPASPFSGSWTSTDTDGSVQTMEIRTAADGTAELTVHDSAASVCSGAPSTMTGTGRLESNGDLVVAAPVLTCDDGSEPEALSGPPLDEQLRDLAVRHDGDLDTLSDSFGVVWSRAGAADPTSAPPTSGAMWPQSSVDEVSRAQELADAGDPAYTWQVDPQLASDEWWEHLRDPGVGAEIVERFLREELGWDTFLFNAYQGDDGDGPADGILRGLVYLRCSPGEANPLYPAGPNAQQEAPGAELCAPTIDELHYETVSVDLSQLDRRGPDGVWVVSGWRTTAPFTQTDPRTAEADTTARLEEFLAARIRGQGAEGYVELAGETFVTLEDVPLLYATTTGARYERAEIERLGGPRWPYGEMDFEIRLFADGGETVVEQLIYSHDRGGRLGLWSRVTHTTENGQPVAVPYGFYDGQVTASAADPWTVSPFFDVALTLTGQLGDERVELVRDPLPVATGCAPGPAPADATALAASIRSDPDLVATAPVPVSIGGAEGVEMDVTVAPGASVCEMYPATMVVTPDDDGTWRGSPLEQGSRMRLYLIDVPDGSATRILAIAIVAPEARFDDVIVAAAPIIDSIELHTAEP